MSAGPLPTQITNRNFLSPTAFHFQVNRAPKLSFYGSSINIPSVSFNSEVQPNYLRDIPIVGTKLDFGELSVRFYIDEGLENYMEIQDWLRGIGYPEDLDEIYKWRKNNPNMPDEKKSELNLYSDGTLTILNSNNNPMFRVIFRDLFPVSLTQVEFDTTITDLVYLQANVNFRYTIYNIEPIDCTKC